MYFIDILRIMSTHKSDVLRNLFALELNAKLTVKYKNIPSAEKIATDIRVSSDYKLDPHGQTVRKWLKGETFPDLVNLAHLVDWLDLNMIHVFETFKYLNRVIITPINLCKLIIIILDIFTNCIVSSRNKCIGYLI